MDLIIGSALHSQFDLATWDSPGSTRMKLPILINSIECQGLPLKNSTLSRKLGVCETILLQWARIYETIGEQWRASCQQDCLWACAMEAFLRAMHRVTRRALKPQQTAEDEGGAWDVEQCQVLAPVFQLQLSLSDPCGLKTLNIPQGLAMKSDDIALRKVLNSPRVRTHTHRVSISEGIQKSHRCMSVDIDHRSELRTILKASARRIRQSAGYVHTGYMNSEEHQIKQIKKLNKLFFSSVFS